MFIATIGPFPEIAHHRPQRKNPLRYLYQLGPAAIARVLKKTKEAGAKLSWPPLSTAPPEVLYKPPSPSPHWMAQVAVSVMQLDPCGPPW